MLAVLFDLDGTLLDLDLSSFLTRYFDALESASADLAREAGGRTAFMSAMHVAVAMMTELHPGATNRDTFYAELLRLTGVDLHTEWPVFERFYRDVFPGLRDSAGPAAGARLAVTTAMDLGLKVAIATNPIFPRDATMHRLAWAGLDDLPVDVVTSYEIMTACKPHTAYYRQVADMLGIPPAECLMVGDDRAMDMTAADIGMLTYYVGPDEDAVSDFRGDLTALAELLPRLV